VLVLWLCAVPGGLLCVRCRFHLFPCALPLPPPPLPLGQDVAIAPADLVVGMLDLLDSKVRYSCAVTAVEESTVAAMCALLERLKTFVCLSFMFLSFDPHVVKSDVVRVIKAARGGSIRLVVRSTLPVLKCLKSSVEVHSSVKYCIPTSGLEMWRCAAFDDAPAGCSLFAMYRGAAKDLMALEGAALRLHLVEPTQRVVDAEMSHHARWPHHVLQFCTADKSDRTVLCLQGQDMDVIREVVVGQHREHSAQTHGKPVYAVCIVQAESATVQSAVLTARASAHGGRLVVCVLGAHLVSSGRRKELVGFVVAQGALCVLCSAVADPEDFCDERCGAPSAHLLSPTLLAVPTKAALGHCGAMQVRGPSGNTFEGVTASAAGLKPVWIVYRVAQLVLGDAVSLRSLGSLFAEQAIVTMDSRGLSAEAKSIAEVTDFAVEVGLVEVVLSTLEKYRQSKGVPVDVPVLCGELPPRKFVKCLVWRLVGLLEASWAGSHDVVSRSFDGAPSFRTFVGLVPECALLSQRQRLWLWLRTVLPSCALDASVGDGGSKRLLGAKVDALVPPGSEAQSPHLLSVFGTMFGDASRRFGYMFGNSSDVIDLDGFHKGEVVNRQEVAWHALAADRSFPVSTEYLLTLLAAMPNPVKPLLCVGAKRLHGILSSIPDLGAQCVPDPGSPCVPSLVWHAVTNLLRALRTPLCMGVLLKEPELAEHLAVLKWHLLAVSSRSPAAAAGGAASGVVVGHVASSGDGAAEGGGEEERKRGDGEPGEEDPVAIRGQDLATLVEGGYRLELSGGPTASVIRTLASLDLGHRGDVIRSQPSLRLAVEADLKLGLDASELFGPSATAPLGTAAVEFFLQNFEYLASLAALPTHKFFRLLKAVVAPPNAKDDAERLATTRAGMAADSAVGPHVRRLTGSAFGVIMRCLPAGADIESRLDVLAHMISLSVEEGVLSDVEEVVQLVSSVLGRSARPRPESCDLLVKLRSAAFGDPLNKLLAKADSASAQTLVRTTGRFVRAVLACMQAGQAPESTPFTSTADVKELIGCSQSKLFMMPAHKGVLTAYRRHTGDGNVGSVQGFVEDVHKLFGGAQQFTVAAPALLDTYPSSVCTSVLQCLAWLHHPYRALQPGIDIYRAFLVPASLLPAVPFDDLVVERPSAVSPLAVFLAKKKGLDVPDQLARHELAHFQDLFPDFVGAVHGHVLPSAVFMCQQARKTYRETEAEGTVVTEPSLNDPRGRPLFVSLCLRWLRPADLRALEVQVQSLITAGGAAAARIDVDKTVAQLSLAQHVLDVDCGLTAHVLVDSVRTFLFLLHAVAVLGADLAEFDASGQVVRVIEWTTPRAIPTGRRAASPPPDPVAGEGDGPPVVVAPAHPGLPCLQVPEAPRTLRLFNVLWSWVLCLVRTDGGSLETVFLGWMRQLALAGALPPDSPAVEVLGRGASDDLEAVRRIDALTGLFFRASPYLDHNGIGYRNFASNYYLHFADATLAYPFIDSVDPYLASPSPLHLFPTLDLSEDVTFTQSRVQLVEYALKSISTAVTDGYRNSPVGQRLPQRYTDSVSCAANVGALVARHAAEVLRSQWSTPAGRERSPVRLSPKDVLLLPDGVDVADDVHRIDADKVVVVTLHQDLRAALTMVLRWLSVLCAELQPRGSARDVLTSMVAGFCGELAACADALPVLWSDPALNSKATNKVVIGATVHAVLASVIGYDSSVTRNDLQALFGGQDSVHGFFPRGLAVDRCSAEVCRLPIDYNSPQYHAFVWWPAEAGIPPLTASAVRAFVSDARARAVVPASGGQAVAAAHNGGGVRDACECVFVDMERVAPAGLDRSVNGEVGVSELAQRTMLGSVVVDGREIIEVRMLPGYLDVRVKPGPPVTLFEVEERRCFEFRLAGQEAKKGDRASDITFPSTEVAWEHVGKMATDPVVIGPGVLLRRQGAVWKPLFMTSQLEAVGGHVSFVDALRLRKYFPLDIQQSVQQLLELLAFGVYAHFNPEAAAGVTSLDAPLVERVLQWYQTEYVEKPVDDRGALRIHARLEEVSVEVWKLIDAIFEDKAHDGLVSVSRQLLDVVTNVTHAKYSRGLKDVLRPLAAFAKPHGGGDLSVLARRLYPVLKGCARTQVIALLALASHEHRWGEIVNLPWSLRKVLSRDFVVESHKLVRCVAAFARKAVGVHQLTNMLFPYKVSTMPPTPLAATKNKTRDPYANKAYPDGSSKSKFDSVRPTAWGKGGAGPPQVAGAGAGAGDGTPKPPKRLDATHFADVLRLLEENIGGETGDDLNYPRHVILPREEDILPHEEVIRVNDRVVAVRKEGKEWAQGKVVAVLPTSFRVLFDGDRDAVDGLSRSQVQLVLTTSSQVEQVAGPNCRRLRFVSPSCDEAYVHFHSSEGLQVCFVVHDCLWQSLLTPPDHRVFLVPNEGKDQRMSAFIAHTLRSPLRWYFKCAVLEALCGQVMGGRYPLRLAPTPNEVVTMHALVDRFWHTVTKVRMCNRVGPGVVTRVGLGWLTLAPCILWCAQLAVLCFPWPEHTVGHSSGCDVHKAQQGDQGSACKAGRHDCVWGGQQGQ
jgi:hypothetical protein